MRFPLWLILISHSSTIRTLPLVLLDCVRKNLFSNGFSNFISGVWFFFFIVYSYFYAMGLPISADFTGLLEIVGSAPAFYLLILLVPIVALTPDVVYKAVKTTIRPDIIDRARAKEQGKAILPKFCLFILLFLRSP